MLAASLAAALAISVSAGEPIAYTGWTVNAPSGFGYVSLISGGAPPAGEPARCAVLTEPPPPPGKDDQFIFDKHWRRATADQCADITIMTNKTGSFSLDCFQSEQMIGSPIESTHFGYHNFRYQCREQKTGHVKSVYVVRFNETKDGWSDVIQVQLNYTDAQTGNYVPPSTLNPALKKVSEAAFSEVTNSIKPKDAKDAADVDAASTGEAAETQKPARAKKTDDDSLQLDKSGEPKLLPLP
jgi:hypothetical protein